MESNKIRIESILANGEHINLECKKATNTIPNSIWETYSSFANTYGGTILLGIVENLKEKDIKKRFQVVGVEDSQKIITDFWNTINSNKVNENILSDSDVNVIDIDGKKVVCINVPQAD
ncbi:MAG: ATP-binding protein [Bacteroidales bacterium]|nr:ATP-binding protein [Bacteroidales bacterium]